MTANTLNKLYDWLTSEERAWLMLNAGVRGDAAEQDRIREASKLLALQVRDYIPWARAFNEMAMIIFMEMLDLAATQENTFLKWRRVFEELQRDGMKEGDAEDLDTENADSTEPVEISEEEQLATDLFLKHLAEGFTLKTRVDGWKLFCERLNVPAMVIWENLPGYERLEAAIERTKPTKTWPGAALPPDAMLLFLQKNRVEGEPEPTLDRLMTAEAIAKELDEMLRSVVKLHGG